MNRNGWFARSETLHESGWFARSETLHEESATYINLLLHLGYRDLQYLHFEDREMKCERIFGPANGIIWKQITVQKIGQSHIVIALVVFQDG